MEDLVEMHLKHPYVEHLLENLNMQVNDIESRIYKLILSLLTSVVF